MAASTRLRSRSTSSASASSARDRPRSRSSTKASASPVSPDPFRPRTTRIASWEDVSALVEHFSYYRNIPWLFRGVSSVEHGLIPLIGRPDWRKPDPHGHGRAAKRLHYSKKDELAVFAMFKNTAVAFLSRQPESEMEWLAVARHYDVPTRFLDWSEKFLVALWFAANGYLENMRDDDPGIWVIWPSFSAGTRA